MNLLMINYYRIYSIQLIFYYIFYCHYKNSLLFLLLMKQNFQFVNKICCYYLDILDKNLIKRLYDKGCDIRLLTKKFKRPISLNEDLKDFSCEKIMVDRFKCFLDTDGPIIQNNYSYDCSVKGMPLRDDTPEFERILIDFKKTFKDNCFEKTFKIIFGKGIVSNDRNELIKYCQKYPDIALFDMIINDYNEFIPQQVKVKDNGE